MKTLSAILLFFCFVLFLNFQLFAKTFTTDILQVDKEILTSAEQRIIIDSLIEKLEGFYIHQEAIEEIKTFFDENYENGTYKEFTSFNDFALKLTQDLHEISKDLHFFVMYEPKWNEDQLKSSSPEIKKMIQEKEIQWAKSENFGFKEVKILEGNIGYLDFRTFHNPSYSNTTATSVMQFLSTTDALIIDLRYNNGGVMEMGQLLSSYLFADKEAALYKYYYFEAYKQKINREMWLLPSVTGERMDKKDIYILTSATTFSAAEWFSYSLQNLKRATLIGEQTAGGAHPIDRKVLPLGFSVNIPFGEVKDPITNSDFEGKGVTPDVKVASQNALHEAHILALQNLSKKDTDSSMNYEWILPILNTRLKPISITQKVLHSYEGKFGSAKLILKEDKLYYVLRDKINLLLTPIEQDLFLVEGTDDFRIKVITKNGKTEAIKRVFEDGNERIYLKE